jgi:hypothetical protein
VVESTTHVRRYAMRPDRRQRRRDQETPLTFEDLAAIADRLEREGRMPSPERLAQAWEEVRREFRDEVMEAFGLRPEDMKTDEDD